MTRITFHGDVHRGRAPSVAVGALGVLLVGAAVTPVAAAPAATATVTDGTLRVSGGPSGDRIALRLGARDANQLEIDFGDDGSAEFTFDRGAFAAIDVQAGNGDDAVRIDQVHGVFTTTEATHVAGDNGDDTLLGGSGAETFDGGRGDDVVDGNGGADTGFLRQGDDVFVWDQGDGSDVVEGGSGADTLVFNGFGANEFFAASVDDGRVRFTRVQGGIVMNLDEVEAIDVNPLGGSDTVTINDLGGTDLERVGVDLAAAPGGSAGDGLADSVTVRGTNGVDAIAVDAVGAAAEVSGLAESVRITHADPAADTLVVDTGAGADHTTVNPLVNALIQVAVQ